MPSWARWWRFLQPPLLDLSRGQFWNPSCQSQSRWSVQSDWPSLLPSTHSWREKSKAPVHRITFAFVFRLMHASQRKGGSSVTTLNTLHSLALCAQSHPKVVHPTADYYCITYICYIHSSLELQINVDPNTDSVLLSFNWPSHFFSLFKTNLEESIQPIPHKLEVQ